MMPPAATQGPQHLQAALTPFLITRQHRHRPSQQPHYSIRAKTQHHDNHGHRAASTYNTFSQYR
jgi:hypothetical protein